MADSTSEADLVIGTRLHTLAPLRHRVPVTDSDGRRLGDFMMIIPGLRGKPAHVIQKTINEIHLALTRFNDMVVFVELNLKLNLLWISHRHRFGIGPEIASAVRERVPEALLVGWGAGM